MSDIRLAVASPAHVGPIATRMRPTDVLECRALGRSPKSALRSGIRSSSTAYTVKVDGRPEAMFGLVTTSALGGMATPWMLGTEEIYRHPREMIRWGQLIVDHWRDSTPALENLVAKANAPALRLLKRWGFQLSEGVIKISGVEFLTFSIGS